LRDLDEAGCLLNTAHRIKFLSFPFSTYL